MRVRSFKKGVAAVAAAVLAVALGAAPAPVLAEDGAVVTNVSYDDSTHGILKVAGGSISGDVVVVKYSGATTTPSLNVTGGYFAGAITATAGTTVNPELNTPSDEVAANVTIDGGTFADADAARDFAKETGLDESAVERVNYVVSFETNGHGSVDPVTVRRSRPWFSA